MHIIEGDLFSIPAKAIGHGVNCKGVMGAGIAKVMRQRFPEMYEAYKEECRSGRLKPGGFFPWYDEASDLWIYNIASQDKPGPDATLNWLAEGAADSLDHANNLGIAAINLPQIGCGIGGLEWDDVERVLHQIERNRNGYFRIVIFK